AQPRGFSCSSAPPSSPLPCDSTLWLTVPAQQWPSTRWPWAVRRWRHQAVPRILRSVEFGAATTAGISPGRDKKERRRPMGEAASGGSENPAWTLAGVWWVAQRTMAERAAGHYRTLCRLGRATGPTRSGSSGRGRPGRLRRPWALTETRGRWAVHHRREAPQMAASSALGRAPHKTAGGLLLTAGATIVMGIITAEALYTNPYTARMEISDLGATDTGVILQPSSPIFNATMLVAGAMILTGAWFTHRALHRKAVTIPTGLLRLGTLRVVVVPGKRD